MKALNFPMSIVQLINCNEFLLFYKSDINSESISRRHMTMQRSNTIQMPSSDSDTDCDVMDFNEVLSSSDIDFDFDDTEEGESEENNRKKRPSTFKRRGKAAYKKTVRWVDDNNKKNYSTRLWYS